MDIATFVKFWDKIRVNRQAGWVFSEVGLKNSGFSHGGCTLNDRHWVSWQGENRGCRTCCLASSAGELPIGSPRRPRANRRPEAPDTSPIKALLGR